MIVLLNREILHTASNRLSKGPGAGDHTHWQCSYLLKQIVWLNWRHGLSFTHHQLAWELLTYNVWTKLHILLSLTFILPCHTAIRLAAQTYPNVAMWAANTINSSVLHSQSESFTLVFSLWSTAVHMDNLHEVFECTHLNLRWVVSKSTRVNNYTPTCEIKDPHNIS